jgi:hypothetical protein
VGVGVGVVSGGQFTHALACTDACSPNI